MQTTLRNQSSFTIEGGKSRESQQGAIKSRSHLDLTVLPVVPL